MSLLRLGASNVIKSSSVNRNYMQEHKKTLQSRGLAYFFIQSTYKLPV